MKRRSFLKIGGMAGLSGLTDIKSSIGQQQIGTPVVVASKNGIHAVEKAYKMIMQRSDALDGVIAGVNTVENDPDDHSVGLGGLPNEEGVVQLDSCCMHGPTHNAGAVAALENVRNASSVARLVMERTDHVLLVGKGAIRFAKAHGFKEENLLTDEARKIWLRWKENLSEKDDWFPGDQQEDEGHSSTAGSRLTGTINCNGLDLNGNLSGVVTTSGLAFKIPGRVGDSPIIGAGLYVDNAVGACGSTGRGEENLRNLSSFMIVEYMRMGKSPQEACTLVCQRIVDHAIGKHLKDPAGRPKFNVKFYAINKSGHYGSAGVKGPYQYAVCDAAGARYEEGAYLYKLK